MAATAYAAVVSLLNTLDQIKIHPFLSTYFNINYSIESLREKVDSFVDFVEKYSDIADTTEAADLMRIADVAREAEDLIEVHAADRIRAGSTTKSLTVLLDLQRITEEMNFLKEKVRKIEKGTELITPPSSAAPSAIANTIKAKERSGFLNRQPSSSSSVAAAPLATANITTMMGFDGYLEQLLDELTGHHSGRTILPIVGMGGIGKTTLATNVYQNSLIVEHFHVRAWVTVSQEFNARKFILEALSCLGGSTSKTDTSESDDKLGEKLYKFLSGRRYLIVLDDIWSVESWEKIKFFFPENNNRSRIVVTTRESKLVDYFGSCALPIKFLDDKNSWELFCERTFAQQGCPHPELEKIGKKIVQKCKGLPLAISVIGGLLGKSSMTQEYWEKIAEDKSPILDAGEGNFKPLSILYLSYKHLPVWLKPCFLYLGLFPKNCKIDVPQLIKLWVAEGFIKAKRGQSLEEVAENYTKELVDRNLLLVGRLGPNKKLKSCRVHDVVRELCIRIGEKEKYFCVQKDIDGMRHFIVDEATTRLFYPRESQETPPSLFRPLILKGQRATPFKSRLMKVLVPDMTNLDSYSQHINLRFIFNDHGYATSVVYWLRSSMQLFWSLQTLIVDSNESFDAPCEIWKMPQLRHIEILESISLPDPPSHAYDEDIIVLNNLQTLKRVENFKLSEEVCERIPNIKELGIDYEFDELEEASSCYHLHNLDCLNKLELLQLYSLNSLNYLGCESLQKVKLPNSLKELTLKGCKLVWSDMEMIASLPHLQILNLQSNRVVGPKWDCVEGKFLCLKHLYIHGCDDVINWSTADCSSFPVLDTLSLTHLSKLEEIPSSIGDTPTLERIYMYNCSESATISVVKILEEQESLGNQSLQLRLDFFYDEASALMWRKKIQQLGITCQNLHINCSKW